jgi:RHS repeat-associated protein
LGVAAQYVWSGRYIDAPICRDRDVAAAGDLGKSGSGLDQRLYYTTDANMNVTALLDTGGDAVERYVYDPYGNVTIYDDDWSDTRSASSYDNAILYCGYYQDSETGLYHVRHRSYHPTLGRWLQRDPAEYGDGASLYAAYFAIHGFTDPLGLWLDPMQPPNTEFPEAPQEGYLDDAPHFVAYGLRWAYGGGKALIDRGGPWSEYMKRQSAVREYARRAMKRAAQAAWDYGNSGPEPYRRHNSNLHISRLPFQALTIGRVDYAINGNSYVYRSQCFVRLEGNRHHIWDIADAHWQKRDYPLLLLHWVGKPFGMYKWFKVDIQWESADVTFEVSDGEVGQGQGGWPFG